MPRGIITPGVTSAKGLSGQTKRLVRARDQSKVILVDGLPIQEPLYITDIASRMVERFHNLSNWDWRFAHGRPEKLSIRSLAAKMGISKSMAQDYMAGKYLMNSTVMDQALKAMGISVQDLISDYEHVSVNPGTIAIDLKLDELQSRLEDIDLSLTSAATYANRRCRVHLGYALGSLDEVRRLLGMQPAGEHTDPDRPGIVITKPGKRPAVGKLKLIGKE